MKLTTSKDIKEAELTTINEYGISGLLLMENAANGMLQIINEKFSNLKGIQIAIFCGSGNNGGDGYALARKLFLKGSNVSIFSTVKISTLKNEAKINAFSCQKLGINITEGKQNIEINKFEIIIDGLLGTGLRRTVIGITKQYIDFINKSNAFVVSIDVPSGLDCDKGIIRGCAVYSDLTITFEKGKVGLYTQPGFKYSKQIKVIPIDIPKAAFKSKKEQYFLFDYAMALNHIKKRNKIVSKGDFGNVVIIAGGKGMIGAYAMCAKASMISGVGYTNSLVPLSKIYEYNQLVSEVVCNGINDDNKEYISYLRWEQIIETISSLKKVGCIVIGPGIPKEAQSHEILKAIFDNFSIPVVIDAQTLNDISKHIEILKNKKGPVVITPHPGEMARLVKTSIENVQENRIEIAKTFANKYDTIVLLKGHKSVVTDGNVVYINDSGNGGMATAGSGDVLAGIIGGKITLGNDMLTDVAYSMYLHGVAGDLAKDKYGENGLNATDIIDNIKQAERKLYEEKTR